MALLAVINRRNGLNSSLKFALQPRFGRKQLSEKMGCSPSRRVEQEDDAEASFVQDLDSTVPPLLREDVERAAAEAAKPLPEGSTWNFNPSGQRLGGEELEEHLAYTTLIDAAWLLKFLLGEVMPEREGVIPAWQDVPPEAKLSLATLRRSTMAFQLPVAVLSYGWAAKGHCDPTGALLRRLIPVLEAMVHSCAHGKGELSPDEKPAAWGIVWDFLSLPQRKIKKSGAISYFA